MAVMAPAGPAPERLVAPDVDDRMTSGFVLNDANSRSIPHWSKMPFSLPMIRGDVSAPFGVTVAIFMVIRGRGAPVVVGAAVVALLVVAAPPVVAAVEAAAVVAALLPAVVAALDPELSDPHAASAMAVTATGATRSRQFDRCFIRVGPPHWSRPGASPRRDRDGTTTY